MAIGLLADLLVRTSQPGVLPSPNDIVEVAPETADASGAKPGTEV